MYALQASCAFSFAACWRPACHATLLPRTPVRSQGQWAPARESDDKEAKDPMLPHIAVGVPDAVMPGAGPSDRIPAPWRMLIPRGVPGIFRPAASARRKVGSLLLVGVAGLVVFAAGFSSCCGLWGVGSWAGAATRSEQDRVRASLGGFAPHPKRLQLHALRRHARRFAMRPMSRSRASTSRVTLPAPVST